MTLYRIYVGRSSFVSTPAVSLTFPVQECQESPLSRTRNSSPFRDLLNFVFSLRYVVHQKFLVSQKTLSLASCRSDLRLYGPSFLGTNAERLPLGPSYPHLSPPCHGVVPPPLTSAPSRRRNPTSHRPLSPSYPHISPPSCRRTSTSHTPYRADVPLSLTSPPSRFVVPPPLNPPRALVPPPLTSLGFSYPHPSPSLVLLYPHLSPPSRRRTTTSHAPLAPS